MCNYNFDGVASLDNGSVNLADDHHIHVEEGRGLESAWIKSISATIPFTEIKPTTQLGNPFKSCLISRYRKTVPLEEEGTNA